MNHTGLIITTIIFIFSILTGCFVPEAWLRAQDRVSLSDSVDTVPRQRLVTNEELLNLLDLSISELSTVRAALETKDTTQALQAVAYYLKHRQSPRYFFEHSEVSKRVKVFAGLYPEAVTQIKKSAQGFMKIYGADVDWRRPGKDQLGREHTPNTIRFLARQAIAENIALMYYLKGGDVRYLDFLIAHIRDFVQDYEAGETEVGANDVFERYYAGHRTRNWLFMHHLLLGTSDYQWQHQIFLLKVFLLHGARLVDQSKRFNWGNHQLHGLVGLCEISTMFPELPVMRVWNQQALKLILEHLDKEIKPDGFQFERASHYFKLDIINYFRVYKISQLNAIELPPFYVERFHRMFDAMVALAKPDHSLPVLHDAQASYSPQEYFINNVLDDQEQKQKVASNDVAELAEPEEALFMSLGAVLFNDPVYKFFGTKRLPADFYWFLEPEALARYLKLDVQTPTVGSIALPESGYYVMRTGWSPDDLYMIIDGGLAQYKPDHSHGQVLGVIAYAFGRDILPSYRVRYSDVSYRTFKNSLVKNVALVDHILQGQNWIDNKARTGFGIWQELPQPTVHEWLRGEEIDYFSGSHDGFKSVGVDYTRSIFFFKPQGWLVIDEFKGEGTHSFQQIWQGEYTIDRFKNAAISRNERAGLLIQQADPAIMQIESKQIFSKKSVQFEKSTMKGYAFTTWLQPFSATSPVSLSLRRFDRPQFSQVVITDSLHQDMIYFRRAEDLKLKNEMNSDAQFVVLRFHSKSLYSVVMHDGTYVRLAGFSLQTESKASIEVVVATSGKWVAHLLKGEHQIVRVNGEIVLEGKS